MRLDEFSQVLPGNPERFAESMRFELTGIQILINRADVQLELLCHLFDREERKIIRWLDLRLGIKVQAHN